MALKTKVTAKNAKPVLPKVGAYQLTQPWTTHDAGMCMWSFAECEGKAYHIKQHISPVCPEQGCGMPADVIAKKLEICDAYYKRMRRLYDAVNKGATGNIVKIEDFFFDKTKFYTVTEKIEHMEVPAELIARLPKEKKLLLLKILAYSTKSLHANGVVHGDMKITNILFKQMSNYDNLVPKLIDFGDSFLVDAPNNYMVGDTYLAPESCLYIDGEDIRVTQKSDVFSLGLLFHEFYTGKLPIFNDKYDYAHEALLDGSSLIVDANIEPAGLAGIIAGMLAESPDARPSMELVFNALQELTNTPVLSWTCENCGNVNRKEVRDCVKCGLPKGSKKEIKSVSSADTAFHVPEFLDRKSFLGGNTMWMCNACKSDNLETSSFCTRCGNPRSAKARRAARQKNNMCTYALLAAALLVCAVMLGLYWLCPIETAPADVDASAFAANEQSPKPTPKPTLKPTPTTPPAQATQAAPTQSPNVCLPGELGCFSLTALDGRTVDGEMFAGNQLTMVNLWATWCGPCVGEMPDLQRLAEDYAASSFGIVGVLVADDDLEGALALLRDKEITYPVVMPEGPFEALSAESDLIPTTFFFDSAGNRVGEMHIGSLDYAGWASLIEAYLAQTA